MKKTKYNQAYANAGLTTEGMLKVHNHVLKSPLYYKNVVGASERLKTKPLAKAVAQLDTKLSLKALTHLLSIRARAAAQMEGGEEGQYAVQAFTRMAWLRHWRYYGYNVFSLSPSLVAKLLLTELPDQELEEFRFPFSAFRIEIPKGFMGILDLDSEICWVRYIDFLRMPWLRWVEPHGMAKTMVGCLNPQEPVDAGTFKWAIFLGSPDARCPGMLFSHHTEARMDTTKSFVDIPDLHNMLEEEIEVASSVAAKIVALNLAHAIASKAVAPRREPQGSSKARNVTRPRVFTFRTARLDLEVLETAKAVGQGARAKAGWRIKSKFIVRGHWRNQAHGPGRQERKRIWIEPFWKGPEGEEGWARKTTVKEKQDGKK